MAEHVPDRATLDEARQLRARREPLPEARVLADIADADEREIDPAFALDNRAMRARPKARARCFIGDEDRSGKLVDRPERVGDSRATADGFTARE